MLRTLTAITAGLAAIGAAPAEAWDHPSHMITAAIAFEEIERMRPDLIERIGLMLMKHPDPAPFWVAATDADTKAPRH